MTLQSQREIIVRPFETDEMIAPMQGDAGDLDNESDAGKDVVVQDGVADAMGGEKIVDTDTRPVWEKMAAKMEDIHVRVARHFEDENDGNQWKPPMVKFPLQPLHFAIIHCLSRRRCRCHWFGRCFGMYIAFAFE